MQIDAAKLLCKDSLVKVKTAGPGGVPNAVIAALRLEQTIRKGRLVGMM